MSLYAKSGGGAQTTTMTIPPRRTIYKAEAPVQPSPDDLLPEGLLSWTFLEPWMQDNKFIRTGYNRPSHSFKKSFGQILAFHNETGNIWTHLLATVLFIRKFNDFRIDSRTSAATEGDVTAVNVYYIAVIACFFLSTIFHSLCTHSHRVHDQVNRADLLGGVFVIWATSVAATHFEFRDQDFNLRVFYWSLSTVFAGLVSALIGRPAIRDLSKTRHVNLFWIWIGFGASTFLPLLHGLYMFGYGDMDRRMSLDAFLKLAVWNGSGAVFYAARIPERFKPGRFDFLGHGHQIMHVFLVMGALSYEKGLLDALGYWTQRTVPR